MAGRGLCLALEIATPDARHHVRLVLRARCPCPLPYKCSLEELHPDNSWYEVRENVRHRKPRREAVPLKYATPFVSLPEGRTVLVLSSPWNLVPAARATTSAFRVKAAYREQGNPRQQAAAVYSAGRRCSAVPPHNLDCFSIV